MAHSSKFVAGQILCVALGVYSAALAREAAAEAATPPNVAGWDDFAAGVRDLPARMLAKLPMSMQNDPQIQQEVGRIALAAIASSTLDALASDGDYPMFVTQIGQALNVGQPNADTIYRVARITPGGAYRLTGNIGSLRMANISQVGAKASAARTRHDINALHANAQGRFDVLLSPTRPADYRGDWWQLEPTTSRLLLRLVSGDWSREKDPTISIERIDRPMQHTRPNAAALEQSLRQLPTSMTSIATLFLDHVEQLRSQGFVNKLKVFDTTQLGGLAGQFYYEGAYALRDDEALIVEAKVPAKCVYRSMILTNDLYETTDWTNNHSSLNDSQAQADADGVLRIVVSAKDPGVPNWLDTGGYSTGVVQGRWADCETQPVPSVRKVAWSDLRTSLPKTTPRVTPEERERIVRERRRAFQERPLW